MKVEIHERRISQHASAPGLFFDGRGGHHFSRPLGVETVRSAEMTPNFALDPLPQK
jgi:hypothetical protein